MSSFQIGEKVYVDVLGLPMLPLDLRTKSFTIIGIDNAPSPPSYGGPDILIQMPQRYGWAMTKVVNKEELKKFKIKEELYNDNVFCWWTREIYVKAAEKKSEGCRCSKCKDFIYMAEGNENFICHLCSQNPFRNFPLSWNKYDE